MPTKSSSRKSQSTTQAENATADTARKTTDAARKTYQEAVRTGSHIQEEAGQWWTKMLTQAGVWSDWQKQFSNLTAMTANTFQIYQRRLEAMTNWIETNGRAGAELMKKAADAAQTPDIAESQNKWLEFWTASLRAAKSNVEASTEVTAQVINSWVEFIRKNGELTQIPCLRTA